MNRYKELNVWKEAIQLAVELYTLTNNFPAEEKYGLINQIRRAGVSVSSNIAEGSGRNSSKEMNQYLGIASGSCCEVESLLIICNRLNLIENDQLSIYQGKILFIQNMIYKLQKTLLNK